MNSVNHGYATGALECVKHVEEKNKKAYGSQCHRFPAMVLTNGLELTVAFFKAKSKAKNKMKTPSTGEAGQQIFIDDLMEVAGIKDFLVKKNCTMSEYRLATHRALAASVWFKRYAEAILGVDQSEAQEESGAGGGL
ncbi:type III-B CRISPR module-associated protein Cmr5 [Paenibacillus sp. y28]|uniref:type III-B CRISPR module-associated protein Cmr5 n=1 Tax=Paenibacillus sp. y28 TaxID=3129110 RepID=UPI00301B276F